MHRQVASKTAWTPMPELVKDITLMECVTSVIWTSWTMEKWSKRLCSRCIWKFGRGTV